MALKQIFKNIKKYFSNNSIQLQDKNEIENFIRGLYRIFLNRDGDSEGIKCFVDSVVNGKSLLEIIEIFSKSDEFKKLNVLYVRKKDQENLKASTKLSFEKLKKLNEFNPAGEVSKTHKKRLENGFFLKYCSGEVILDIGFSGYDNPEKKTFLPNATGIDLDYPGYDGIHLPFPDESVDTIHSSHALEHIQFDCAAIREWHRVLKIGGFIVCTVPSQALYEKKLFLPSKFNYDHKRMYTASSLCASFDSALEPNTYKIRHLRENDDGYDYSIDPDNHSVGCFEFEIVVEKIKKPLWSLE